LTIHSNPPTIFDYAGRSIKARRGWKLALSATLAACLAFPLTAQQPFAVYDDVRPILGALTAVLPPELRVSSESKQRGAWPGWVRRHDREIRARLARGDADMIVNWLMLGTSFTQKPRAIMDVALTSQDLPRLVLERTSDLISALAYSQDERTVYVRGALGREGYGVAGEEERTRLRRHLEAEVERVLAEWRLYATRLIDARRTSNIADDVLAESRLFRDRGVSLDTTWFPGFSVQQALAVLRDQRAFSSANSIRRVAIIGPGLDFADKNFGYDFYPLQTLQPFTLIDSLVRLKLAAKPNAVEVTTLDISERVNDHIRAIPKRAKSGAPYVLHLPLDLGASMWEPELVSYWRQFGDRIGTERTLPKPPDIGKQLEVRGVDVPAGVASRVTPVDFNVITQRWTSQPFDLVIATNVFVYYDTLDQSLALASIEGMLRPGGFLLTNNAIVEPPSSRLRSKGVLEVPLSSEPVKHDRIFWYRHNE
jgi:hypothetical protein